MRGKAYPQPLTPNPNPIIAAIMAGFVMYQEKNITTIGVHIKDSDGEPRCHLP